MSTRKNKKKSTIESQKKNSYITYDINYKTPRTEYYHSFFSKPPTLLEKNPMFQIYYNTFLQFVNYVSIYPKEYKNKNYPDCFINTLFALGLRDIDKLHMDINNIHTLHPSYGITTNNICRYLETSFGIPIYSVTVNNIFDSNHNTVCKKIHNEYSNGIKNHYATIVFLYKYNKNTMKLAGHVIIVFKHNDEIWFFDPQSNILTETINVMYSSNIILLGYSSFMAHNITSPKQLLKTSYYFPLSG